MSFITSWIENHMEDPDDRQNKQLAHVNKQFENARKLRAMWATNDRPERHWQLPRLYTQINQDIAHGGSDGKQTKFMANPTSRANTYDSVLHMYATREERMGDKLQESV